MPEYYGGAPNAFAGGQEFGAAQRSRKIKENALNALIAKYGPEAADPQAAALMQRAQQSSELHPYDVAEAQRVDAARGAMVQEHGAIAGDPAAQARDIELEDRDNMFRLQAGRRAAAVLQRVKANKGDLGSAFDFIQQALPAVGIPPESLAVIRDAITKDPDNVDEFVAMLADPEGQKALSGGQPMYDDATGKLVWAVPTADGTMRVMHGYTPATAAQAQERLGQGYTRLQQGQQKLTNEELKRRGLSAPEGYEAWLDPETGVVAMAPVADTKQAQEFEKNIREADTSDRAFVRAAEITDQRSKQILDNATKALEYFQRADGGVLLQNLRRGAEFYAGIDLREAKKALDTIRNNVAVDELLKMKQSSSTGASGMGSLTAPELELLRGSRGILETSRDPEELVSMLENIVAGYTKIQELATSDATIAQQRMEQRRQQYGPELKAPRAPATTAPAKSTVKYPENPYRR